MILPAWVYDLIAAVEAYEDIHCSHGNSWPCLNKALSGVPEQQRHASRSIVAWRQESGWTPPAGPVDVEVRCGRECSEMHTYRRGSCEAAISAEPQQDEAAGRILAYLDDHRARYPYDATGVIADLPAAYDNGLLPLHELLEADLRAVLAERDSLALRIAKLKS